MSDIYHIWNICFEYLTIESSMIIHLVDETSKMIHISTQSETVNNPTERILKFQRLFFSVHQKFEFAMQISVWLLLLLILYP